MKYSKLLESIKGKISELLEQDVEICLNTVMATAIENWAAMYADEPAWLSRKKGIRSAGLPCAIAAELARLVTLEFKSTVSDKDIDAAYQKALKSLRVQTEYACALGGMVFKPYPVDNGVNVQFIRANCFLPISFDGAESLTGCAFVEQISLGKKTHTRLEVHTLESAGLRVRNAAYMSTNKELIGNAAPLDAVPQWAELEADGFFPNANKMPFGYFKIPLANTIDPDSPLGVSVYSRADNLIQEADRRYSNECWEFEATQAAVHIAEGMLKKEKATGNFVYPEGRERLYRVLEYSTGAVDKPLIDPFLPEIRQESIEKGYQAQLKRIEFECGLAYGTLSDPQSTDKTAEEIKASKQRSYATVTDIQMALETALRDLVDAIAFWLKKPTNGYEITFAWDDSIITDSNALANRKLLEYQAGLIDEVEYFMAVYGKDKAAADELVKEMQARKPKTTVPSDPFGGGV